MLTDCFAFKKRLKFMPVNNNVVIVSQSVCYFYALVTRYRHFFTIFLCWTYAGTGRAEEIFPEGVSRHSCWWRQYTQLAWTSSACELIHFNVVCCKNDICQRLSLLYTTLSFYVPYIWMLGLNLKRMLCNFCSFAFFCLSHLIYPLTTRVVGAPQMISQPIFLLTGK